MKVDQPRGRCNIRVLVWLWEAVYKWPPVWLAETTSMFVWAGEAVWLQQQHNCCLAGLAGVFPSVHNSNSVYLKCHNKESDCWNKCMSAVVKCFHSVIVVEHLYLQPCFFLPFALLRLCCFSGPQWRVLKSHYNLWLVNTFTHFHCHCFITALC